MDWVRDLAEIGVALLLVVVNGFFVAAEFALVKVRGSQIKELVQQRRPFAKTALWLAERLDGSLSACQLGITMASLALGWVGEPAFAHLIEPVFHWLGIHSEVLLHGISFVIAFTAITALHLTIGEQAPKIYAIRRADQMVLWCALPLKLFYLLTYPLMVGLSLATAFLLRLVGLEGASEHETPHSEQEIRALLREAHVHGNLTRSEHRLIDAVFEFDDTICRRVMVPRGDVDFFDVSKPISEFETLAKRTRHTRFPVCNGSLDEVLGVIHLKDLFGLTIDESLDWNSMMRPPRKVPETMPISKLLRHFQATHQLLAFVVDEYGTVIGIATLENVLEQIIGDVADEFDQEPPNIVSDGPERWTVLGSTPLDLIARKLDIDLLFPDIDTFSGYLMQQAERMLSAGDQVQLNDDYAAEVLEVRDDRAYRIRVTRVEQLEQEANEPPPTLPPKPDPQPPASE